MAILTGTRDIILGYLQEFDLIQHHWSLAVHDSLTLTSVLSHRCQKQQTWRVGEDAQSHICLSLAQTILEEALQSTCKWSAVGRSGQFYLVKLPLEYTDLQDDALDYLDLFFFNLFSTQNLYAGTLTLLLIYWIPLGGYSSLAVPFKEIYS